jgi:hypothetical protein
VASSLNSFRGGAVGFIDWLDRLTVPFSTVSGQNQRNFTVCDAVIKGPVVKIIVLPHQLRGHQVTMSQRLARERRDDCCAVSNIGLRARMRCDCNSAIFFACSANDSYLDSVCCFVAKNTVTAGAAPAERYQPNKNQQRTSAAHRSNEIELSYRWPERA